MDLEPAASFDHLGPWPEDGGVVLACSGGADSTYLALAWRQFAAALGPTAPHCQVWVVDHGHRPGSTGDAEKARDLYLELGFEVQILTSAAKAEGSIGGRNGRESSVVGDLDRPASDENSLRKLRYGLFEEAIHRSQGPSTPGAQTSAAGVDGRIFALLTAHHADDQAETVLLRILRGTGLRGLAGIPARRPLQGETLPGVELRRPLLHLRAADIRQQLRKMGQTWIEDPSNNDPTAAARNRLRQEVMPLLAQIATGDPAKALLRLNHEAAEWRSWLEDGLQVDEEGPNWLGQWKALPSVIRREAVADLLRQHGHKVSPTRLRNLETALLAHGSAAINKSERLSISGGRLRCLPIRG